MNTMNKPHLPSVKRTFISFLGVLLWLIGLLVTAFFGLFLHTLIGSILLIFLVYLTSQQVMAKASALKKERENYINSYIIGEKYLNVFSVERRKSLL